MPKCKLTPWVQMFDLDQTSRSSATAAKLVKTQEKRTTYRGISTRQSFRCLSPIKSFKRSSKRNQLLLNTVRKARIQKLWAGAIVLITQPKATKACLKYLLRWSSPSKYRLRLVLREDVPLVSRVTKLHLSSIWLNRKIKLLLCPSFTRAVLRASHSSRRSFDNLHLSVTSKALVLVHHQWLRRSSLENHLNLWQADRHPARVAPANKT